jgi:Cu/Ag efflux protein CusF
MTPTRLFARPPALLAATLWAFQALAQAALPVTEAEVRRIDPRAQTITLKHGEIKNLDMPPMTMVFRVKDPAWLQSFKPGDKVRFTVDHVGGQYTVLSLERGDGPAAR